MGTQPLENLKDMLSKEEYIKCTSIPYIEKTWYKMTFDVFVAFFFQIIFLLSYFFRLILHCKGSYLVFMLASILMLVLVCHFQQEIVEASDDAAKKYYKKTCKDDRSDTVVTVVMRATAKSKKQFFKG